MRWADLDQLGHVNNVTYLQYAQEARDALVESVGSARFVAVDFRAPMLLGRHLVEVRSVHLGDGALRQRIGVEGSDVVFAEVTSSPAAPDPVAVIAGRRNGFTVRRADFDAGRLTLRALFEIFQELRVRSIDDLFEHRSGGRFVVARTEATIVEPPVWIADELTAVTRIEHVGTSSYRMASQLLAPDGRVLLASTSAMVAFDPQTQRPRPLADHERAALLAELG